MAEMKYFPALTFTGASLRTWSHPEKTFGSGAGKRERSKTILTRSFSNFHIFYYFLGEGEGFFLEFFSLFFD